MNEIRSPENNHRCDSVQIEGPNQEDLMNSVVEDERGMRLRNPYLFELLANLEQDLLARKELLEK
ncbi:hypothetical protein RUM44_012654 [Polyplax serrata]|uniref:Uncharacterized protein n=1 Tax=Polyplax serrata TaxID=468196 RepID=A0ABR1BFQ6_POLSC